MLRALILSAVVLVSPPASAGEGTPWRASAASPLPGLPTVTIELGYPGPYVPWPSAPITLRATAGDRPFDGYIGFHFRVQEQRTYDTPVIARAVLAPNQTWTFSTFASLQRWAAPGTDIPPRTIAVEWRDASMKVRAMQPAGVPPWAQQRLPLRVDAGEALPDRAQWYAGFSGVVAPLAVWSDLPLRVREAIVGSGTEVVLFGLPQPGRKLDALDIALLPVAFEARPGSYEVPWPYGSGTVAVPMSWRVRAGAARAGHGPLPYLVRSAVATWAADESAVNRPLPAMARIPIPLYEAFWRPPADPVHTAWPRPAQLFRVHPALLLGSAAALLGLTGWLLLRRRPRATIAAALLAAAVLVTGAREQIRPSSGTYRYEIDTPVSHGIIEQYRLNRSWGSSPLAAEQVDKEAMRTSVTGASLKIEDAEVRGEGTPVSMGLMKRQSSDWHALTRWSRRREPGDAPRVRIRSRNGNALVLDYESAVPVEFLQAEWLCGERLCRGEVAVARSSRGSATIRDARRPWSEEEFFIWSAPLAARPASLARVALLARTRRSTRVLEWLEPAEDRAPASFLIATRDTEDPGRFAFALPPDLSPRAGALVSVKARDSRVDLTWRGGTVTLAPTGRAGVPVASRSYSVPPDVLREIVATGGIAQVSVSAVASRNVTNALHTVSIEIREKKP